MKEIKTKSTSTTDSSGAGASIQKATEEQIRYAKLSQINTKDENRIQEKIKEVSEFTQKPSDIVYVALHDNNYDTTLAIQSILEGNYDEGQGEWKTTATRKSKKPSTPVSNSVHHTDSPESTNKINNDTDQVEEQEQKPVIKPNRLSRGGETSGSRGRSSSRNWRSDDRTPREERFEQSHDRDGSKERTRQFNDRDRDRGRGRGRGRGGRGGGMTRGMRGGRGGFGRGPFKGSNRLQNRGSNKGGFSRGRDNYNKKEENGNLEPAPEESWDLDTDATNEKVEVDWADDIVDDTLDSDWPKGDWGDEPEPTSSNATDSLFSHNVSWSQMNGNDTDSWNDARNSPKDDRGTYLPESIDTAVIRSIPTSSTSGEVTSYQPTNDIRRYINSASNQFPSSHQEGGLTSSLNDRTFSLQPDSVTRTIASMPIVSGVTESHKLEQEQLRTPKHQCLQKHRKAANKYVHLPSQPVVMPRSAQMVNDIEEQFAGLEFGSGPLSPRVKKVSGDDHLQSSAVIPSSSTSLDINQSAISEGANRHPVTTLTNESLMPQSTQGLASQPLMAVSPVSKIDSSNIPSQAITKSDIPKTPPGFKPLDQPNTVSHYSRNSPGRALGHMAPEPILFPSSTTRTSPTPQSSLNVFSRSGGLGMSVTVSDQQSLPKYNDQQVYDQREQNINAEKILADQRVLAEKQYLAEQQRVLSEHRERERTIADQRAFAEQKSLAQQKLLASQRSQTDPKRLQDDSSRSERISTDLSDERNSIPEQRINIKESPLKSMQSTTESKITSSESSYLNTKIHNKSSPVTTLGPPPGVHVPSSYSSNAAVSNEMLGLTSATGVQTTTKTHSATSKTSTAPPGVIPQMNLYAGVQPGMIPTYQHQPIHGYNYEELLMQRLPLNPYPYDVSMFPAATGSTREGIQTYQGSDSKFTQGADESSPVSIQQGNPHVAAGNITAHQQAAYLSATGQLPFGYTYAYQPGVLPQGGVYPAFTTPSAIYQVTQAKGVGGTQYQSQYQGPNQQQQGGYNSSKFSGSTGHDYSKSNYHSAGTAQPGLNPHAKGNQQNVTSSVVPSSAGGPSVFKSQYNQDGKGFLGSSPSSMNTQAGMHLHNPAAAAAHLSGMNHYLLQQHNMMAHSGQVSATHLGHHHQVEAATHRSPVHPMQFGGNQQKRDGKGNYQSYWSGSR